MIYVCSDIHGVYPVWQKIKSYISKDDELYVIGDVIDRGQDGIRILKEIMTSSNIHMLIGNHEDFMISSLLFHDRDKRVVWRYECNGGDVTYSSFLKENVESQKEILTWLYHQDVYRRLNVNGQQYLLVHGCNFDQTIHGDSASYADLYHNSFIDEYLWNSLWKDSYITLNDFNPNEITINGHVPIFYNDFNNHKMIKKKNVYCIDGGLAYYDTEIECQGILYCLDNGEEVYIGG